MPQIGINLPNRKSLRAKVKIVAVPGKVKQIDNGISIPIEKIPLNALIKETNDQGKFILNLLPGKYTFFILKGKEAYRNNFDGKGFFTQTEVNENIDNLVLIYDRFAFY